MKNKLKTLHIPYVPELDQLPLANSGDLMEMNAAHQCIDLTAQLMDHAYKPLTLFDIARGDHDFYIRYFVRGNFLRAVCTDDQQPVYGDSCVSVVFKNEVTGSLHDFTFNCIGTCAAAYGKAIDTLVAYDVSELKKVRRFAEMGTRPFYEMEGFFAWQLTVAIPFTLLGLDKGEIPVNFTANFCKRSDATSLPHFISWAPAKSDVPGFLQPEYFGKLVIE